ncbi:hypothetical protein B0H67DRAFT_579502 [Lasiosphaeris hirsuta]|uniref:Myb-like domain-containing protein n=1 Tax=Lasiosphaeris hirsuta TaxID=260670 RepID=A0AA40AFJ8_9PEZI|nr:hypothetical protein B0H67DRAFT_579502 [Lasiosphaeris hirsuta]
MDLDGSSSSPGPASSKSDEFSDDSLSYNLPVRHRDAASVGSEYDPLSEEEASESAGSEDSDDEKGKAERGPPELHPAPHGPHRSSPLKRPLQSPTPTESERPFKRAKGLINTEYLTLLNTEIQDASAGIVIPNRSKFPATRRIGLTSWSAMEKEIFFGALSRLGPDNLAGIAAKIGTKGELEVAQYLRLLADTARVRERQDRGLPTLQLADIPAAIELSQECCKALEEAGNAFSMRQEAYEETREKKRWGENNWLIDSSTRKKIEKKAPPQLKSVGLFRVDTWLRLSKHVFMNSSSPEYNWTAMSDDEPAIRATALEDFYSIVASLARRIISASIYESQSRIRSVKSWNPAIRHIVRRKDVETAVLSLGLRSNKQHFWAGAARRLKLNVPNDEHWYGSIAYDKEAKFMPYNDVEQALGGVGKGDVPAPAIGSDNETDSENEDTGMSDMSSDDTDDDDSDAIHYSGGEAAMGDSDESVMEDGDQDEVQQEANELFVYSAIDYSKASRAKTAVKNRIKVVQAEDAYAGLVDARAACDEEKRLWELLGRTPATELATPNVSEVPTRRKRLPIDDLILSTSVGEGRWRDAAGAAAAKWEVEASTALERLEMEQMDDEE